MSTSAIDVRSEQDEVTPQTPPLRFVTAASLFDGHDAAINVMRRLIQDGRRRGRSTSATTAASRDVVRAAIQEDADGIAISSYQGGHIEYFKYAVDMLRERGAGHIRVFGGGGGTITPAEIAELEAYGVERDLPPGRRHAARPRRDDRRPRRARARSVQALSALPPRRRRPTTSTSRGCSRRSRTSVVRRRRRCDRLRARVDGGGRGRPRRRRHRHRRRRQEHRHRRARSRASSSTSPTCAIAVLAVDPTRRRTGGALLGDRIRMNSLRHEQRLHALDGDPAAEPRDERRARRRGRLPARRGLRPGDRRDRRHRPERLGDRRPRRPARLRDDERVRRRRASSRRSTCSTSPRSSSSTSSTSAAPTTRCATCASSGAATTSPSTLSDDEVPVYPTIASQFDDPGVTWLFVSALRGARPSGRAATAGARSSRSSTRRDHEPRGNALIPGERVRYLAEIAEQGRGIDARVERARRRPPTRPSTATRRSGVGDRAARAARAVSARRSSRRARAVARRLQRGARRARRRGARRCCESWDGADRGHHRRDVLSYEVRGTDDHRRRTTANAERTQQIPKIAPPRFYGLGRPAALPDEGEPARLLPLHRRRLPLPARGRGPDPDVRRRGHARSAPTGASTTSRRASRRRASRPPSTRSRSTARTPPSAPTSTARSATPASRSRPSTTPRSSTRASTSARRRPRSR